MPFKNEKTVRRIIEKMGGHLNTITTMRFLAQYCIRNDAIVDLMHLRSAGMIIDPDQVQLMHLCALFCHNQFAGMYLLDVLRQDPLERDTRGRTVLDLPDVASIHLKSQIRDAMHTNPHYDLAVMMGVHTRLGGESFLQCLPVELIRKMILPYSGHYITIEKVRAARLKEFAVNEGVTIQSPLEFNYVYMGCGDVTFADFRRAHFLAVTPGLLSNLPKNVKRSRPVSREMLTRRLTAMGFLFNEPYTSNYAGRAAAALKQYK